MNHERASKWTLRWMADKGEWEQLPVKVERMVEIRTQGELVGLILVFFYPKPPMFDTWSRKLTVKIDVRENDSSDTYARKRQRRYLFKTLKHMARAHAITIANPNRNPF